VTRVPRTLITPWEPVSSGMGSEVTASAILFSGPLAGRPLQTIVGRPSVTGNSACSHWRIDRPAHFFFNALFRPYQPSIALLSVIVVRMGTEKPMLIFPVEPAMMGLLDDFRFKNRFPSNWGESHRGGKSDGR